MDDDTAIDTTNIRGIYMIRNAITGDSYVGKSNNIQARWLGHKSALRRGEHYCDPLQTDWMIYGESAFEFLLLMEVSGTDSLQTAESAMIEKHHPQYDHAHVKPEPTTLNMSNNQRIEIFRRAFIDSYKDEILALRDEILAINPNLSRYFQIRIS